MLFSVDQRRHEPALPHGWMMAGAILLAALHAGVWFWLDQGTPSARQPADFSEPFLILTDLRGPENAALREQIALRDQAPLFLPSIETARPQLDEAPLPEPFRPFRENLGSVPSPSGFPASWSRFEEIPVSDYFAYEGLPDDFYGAVRHRPEPLLGPVAAATIEVRAFPGERLVLQMALPQEVLADDLVGQLWSPLIVQLTHVPEAAPVTPHVLADSGDPERDTALLAYLQSPLFRARLPYGTFRVIVGP